MNFYHPHQPGTFRDFAQFIAIGTWTDGEILKCCRRSTNQRIPPLQMMWVPGSKVVGDFSWDGGFVCAVQAKHIPLFRSYSVPKHNFHQVEHHEYDGSDGKLRKNSLIVNVPYQGPELRWFWTNDSLQLDLEKSKINVRQKCEICGHITFDFRLTDLVVQRDAWSGQHVFRLHEFGTSDVFFVTEELKRAIDEQDLSNIKFALAGRIT